MITLIGMAVGVDYSLFYLKREREERHAGRDALAAVEIASATSGRAILVSGFTVMVAMAGQFLTGDKGATSFAVGTIMVVAVAMLGSLTALPAMLALLGRHVDKGRVRIPFLRRRRPARTESRVWSAILDRVLARPAISAVASVLVLLAIASPALHLKVHNTGINDLPPNLPGITVLHHLEQAFPNSESPAVVVVQAADTTAPGGHARHHRAAQRGAGRRHGAPARHHRHERRPHGHHGRAAAGRQRHQPGVHPGARQPARHA